MPDSMGDIIGYAVKRNGPQGWGFYYECSRCHEHCSLCHGEGVMRGIFPALGDFPAPRAVVCPQCCDRWRAIRMGDVKDPSNGPPAGSGSLDPAVPACSKCGDYLEGKNGRHESYG
jgi:hypothetical protein